MVTPTAAPTSTSVGASAPNAMRATPTMATRPAAAHLPTVRPRPAGTSVYNTPTSVAARRAHLCGRHRPATPTRSEVHSERSRTPHDRPNPDGVQHHDQLGGDHQHDQVAKASQPQQHQHQPQPHQRERHPGAERRETLKDRGDTRCPQLAQPSHGCVVGGRHRHGDALPSTREDDNRQPHQHHRRGQPAQASGLHVIRQRRRRTGRTTPARRPHDHPGWRQPLPNHPGRLLSGDAHGPPSTGSRPTRHRRDAPYPGRRHQRTRSRYMPRVDVAGASDHGARTRAGDSRTNQLFSQQIIRSPPSAPCPSSL